MQPVNGALVVLTDIETQGSLSMSVHSPDYANLGFMLEQVGGRCEPRIASGVASSPQRSQHGFSFTPQNVRTWGESDYIRSCRALSVVFDPQDLETRLWGEDRQRIPDEPWLSIPNERMFRLARLLAQELEAPGAVSALYADHLVVALGTQLLGALSTPHKQPVRGLGRARLRRVLEYIEDNIAQRIQLADLAKLAGLSQSQFSVAFKQATGMPPHRYHLAARVRRVQARIRELPDVPLAELATELGFADQAHLGRVFRAHVGQSPRAWGARRR